MRKYGFTLLIWSFSILLLGTSCRSSRTVTMDAVQPAEISIHPEIKTLLLLDRTVHSRKVIGILEGVLTGETPGEDKAAIQEAMNALTQSLHSSYRFQVKVAAERLKGNSFTQAFPQQLPWSVIESLCAKYNADAVIVFEMFDSDFIVTRGKKKPRKVVDPETKQERVIQEFYAEGVGDVKMGLRFYDPVSKQIVDQQSFKQTRTWQATANSEAQAAAKLIDKGRATVALSAGLGSDYAFRISPMPIRISRSYYRKAKKSPSVEIGARMAEVGNWQGAIEVWKGGLSVAEPKVAGYLCHNIAVAFEVLGDLDEAIRWAQDGYQKYGHKDDRAYVSRLNNRVYQLNQLRRNEK